MTETGKLHRLDAILGTIGIVAAIALIPAIAQAQRPAEFNKELSALDSRVSAALSNQTEAGQVVDRLDEAEADFARMASSGKAGRDGLAAAYGQLESMLNRIYTTYKKKKEDCIAAIENGAQCDYDTPEQIELRALYPLSWLRFQGASTIYSGDSERARRLLSEAIDGFTQSTLVIVDPNLIRENLLGRAYCERELGKYSKPDYDKAIRDFKQIVNDGPETKQYHAAEQGLATTYAAMGQMDKAAKLTQSLAVGATGGQKAGMEMLRLQSLLKAEAAAHDPAKKAEYHKEAVDFMKRGMDDKAEWAIVVTSVIQNVSNPVAEFGRSSDPFEKHLLADVLYAKKDLNGAAKYFLEAARSGTYPRDYRYAADIFYQEKRLDLVDQVVNELARQPGNPDARWAAYMRFKLPRTQWEQTGMANAKIENQWTSAGEDYLKRYGTGEHSNEVRFRLAERLQRARHYAEAAKMYSQVTGGEYGFAADFNQAECALAAASQGKDPSVLQVNARELRKTAISLLERTVRTAPGAERGASSAAQRKFVHDVRGRAIYMLASLLHEQQGKANADEIAALLAGYEDQYPSMSTKFDEILEWRVQALDELGRYGDIERDLSDFLARNQRNTRASDFIKEIGLDFWKKGQMKLASGDRADFERDAKLTAVAYGYFENEVKAGRMQARDLTGTLSILGQADLALGDEGGAESVFNQVVEADPASPDANAGLARIAQNRENYKDAVNLWANVENTAAESDILWYDAKYNLARIYAAEGNVQAACSKLAQTRAEHPSLGTPEMRAKWDALQRKLCLTGRNA